ncbi:MAG: amidohydrolase family protein [Solirubrobacterales bacterium]|nr:amidohydrolase family protein [Solirubrobacterales bacterium]
MPVDDALTPLYARARQVLPAGTEWFDAHTHIGQNDPDGMTGTLDALIAGLDEAGHERALVFAMHEPGGYAAANDIILEAAGGSGGRLTALARVDPGAHGAVREARRALAAGARGIKLHPRSDAFALPHPVVDELVALVAEVRGPVLFHAGRGIPHLGEAVTDLARRHPDARLILAHAGISDLGWIAPAAAELPNLFFDTAWWQVWDLLALFCTVAPGQILYASDMPYGSGVLAGLIFLRVAQAAGLAPEALATIAGGQLGRVVGGEDPVDLGPAPGPPQDRGHIGHERAVAYLTAACQQTFGGHDPTEALALARLACRTPGEDPILARVDELVARVQELRAGKAVGGERWPAVEPLVAAQLVAGTPSVAV